MSRSPGGTSHISVHTPLRQRESLKQNRKAYLLDFPDGHFVCANLVIGCAGIPLDCPLPVGISGQTLWRTQLRDGRPAVLVGRLLELDDQNRGHIRYFREELGLTATVLTMPASSYFEIHNLHWSPQDGNVILVVPMGEEAFRSEQDFPQPGAMSIPPRHFHYRNPRSTVDLIAPNGLRVAVIEVAEVNKVIELMKGLPRTVELGLVTMRIEPSNLVTGSRFIAPPCRLICGH